MKDERLLALIDLQSVITRKYNLYRTHESIPERLEQLRGQLAKAETELETAASAVKENEQALARSRKEIKQVEEKLQSLQLKLNQVKTTREYETRQKEIKLSRERIAELERYVTETEGKTELLQEAVKTAEAGLEAVRAKVGPEIETLEGQSELFEAELAEIEGEEQEKRVLVPGEILQRVDKLVLLRAGNAVVPVVDGCCGGCGIQLSPQTIQVAKRGLDLIQCDRCSSYVYWDSD
ncbi:MAG: hypothetical protein HUU16_03140 [Candidatus Omnitrophica bacterium]|nr:hypothetical protein [bacterium]NUN95146.1 hypothetical protein [Candidatus Omnitrophota bacterium]